MHITASINAIRPTCTVGCTRVENWQAFIEFKLEFYFTTNLIVVFEFIIFKFARLSSTEEISTEFLPSLNSFCHAFRLTAVQAIFVNSLRQGGPT